MSQDSPSPYRRALVTAGGTREAIDDVRVISNRSTGRLGSRIALALAQAGVQTTLLTSAPPGAEDPLGLAIHPLITVVSFVSFADLDAALRAQCNESIDLLLMAAAVSDYSPDTAQGKLSSAAETMQLTMRRNPKLIDRLRTDFPDATLIGFKLTSGQSTEQRRLIAKAQCQRARLDATFVNDIAELSESRHPAELVFADQRTSLPFDGSREAVARQLVTALLAPRNGPGGPAAQRPPLDIQGPDHPGAATLLAELPGTQALCRVDGCVLTRLASTGTTDAAILRALALASARGRTRGPGFAIRTGEHGLLGLTDPDRLRASWAAIEEAWAAQSFAIGVAGADVHILPLVAAGEEIADRGGDPRLVGAMMRTPHGAAPFVLPEYRRHGLGDRAIAWCENRRIPLLDHPAAALGPYYLARGHVEAGPIGESRWTRFTPPGEQAGVCEAASICLYEPRSRQVLLGHRTAGGWLEHFAFPGGKLDPGESALDAARRELLEETGIVATADPVSRCSVHTWSEGYSVFRVTNYLILVTRCAEPIDTPELSSRWVSVDTLDDQRPMAAGTRRVCWAYGLGRGGDAWLDRLEGC